MTRPLPLTPRQLDEAAHAWEIGGSAVLGLWCARNRLIHDYGRVVRLVREYLHDDTDYSQETA